MTEENPKTEVSPESSDSTSEDAPSMILERKSAFLLAALLLSALVSISFFNLDRLPAIPPLSDKMVSSIAETNAPVIFAGDPIALAALEKVRADLTPSIFPLTTWPPEGPLLAIEASHRELTAAGLEKVVDDGVWTLWLPRDFVPLPFLGLAEVELEDADGRVRSCPRDAEGANQCGRSNWTRMRFRATTVDGERETCIWAHPIKDKTLRFRFPDVMGAGPEDKRLWLESGLRDVSVGTGAPVDFLITLGDETTSHRHIDRRGWQSVQIPKVDEPRELIVEVSADRPGRRHLCYRFDFR